MNLPFSSDNTKHKETKPIFILAYSCRDIQSRSRKATNSLIIERWNDYSWRIPEKRLWSLSVLIESYVRGVKRWQYLSLCVSRRAYWILSGLLKLALMSCWHNFWDTLTFNVCRLWEHIDHCVTCLVYENLGGYDRLLQAICTSAGGFFVTDQGVSIKL